jgi:photosystem II stability/assembly factor-like uncharacterized protein
MTPKTLANALLVLTAFTGLLAPQETRTEQPGAQTFQGLELRGIGPALMSGRIADIAIHPQDRSTWYVAVGSGGVWKTVNGGTTWTPVFDEQPSYSIGCLALDPNDPDVVWVGTGENVSGRHVGYGDGVYLSRDGGRTWENKGLSASEHIGKILVDPRDSNVVYVAAEGPLWSSGGERGVFKTTDGGEAWTAVLEISENTGVTDMELDPRNPDVIYAAAYQRRRTVWALLAGGPESAIYKTTDGGTRWRELTVGLPRDDMGKIGLAVSPVNPDVVYASIEAAEEEKGFYRSADSGESWEKQSDYISNGTGPHYYQEIEASPHRVDLVYQMDVWIHVTEDGGKSFERLGEPDKHSDNHALAFVADDPGYLLAGCDGGLYESWDHGRTWRYIANLPVTHIYKLALDNDSPFYNVVGGTQDNGTQAGPSQTGTLNGIRNADWYVPYGADGYACAVDPEDANLLYVTWQNGHLLRYDRRNGEVIDIQPQPGEGDPPERWNWDAPLLISPHSRTRIYFGSQRLWRSDDRGDSWTPVSGDLSRGENRYELEIMGRVWSVDALYDNGAMSWYGNLTSISESPLVEGLIYAGTDDGLIRLTEDGGESWRRVDAITGVPERAFVNDVRASVVDPDTIFVLFDNHKFGDYRPYAVKSTDRGRTWSSIAGDLPDRHILWSLVQDDVDPELLFLGTEFGIFFTRNGGANWTKLEGGVPTIAFRDLEIQRRETDLVGASFGRGFYVFDDYSPLRQASEEALAAEAKLFPVGDARLYVPARPLGGRGKAYQGSDYYVAPNPPFGAVFTYHLREDLQTDKEARRAREKEIRAEGGDVPFPGWETLEQEERQDEPKILLLVWDEEGRVIRRIEGPSTKGLHRVAWDLHFPSHRPTEIEPPRELDPWDEPPRGPMVTPGRYSVGLARLIDGNLETLTDAQSFDVVALDPATLDRPDPESVLAFERQTADLHRKALGAREETERTARRLEHIEEAILDTPGIDAALLERVRQLRLSLADLQEELVGDPTRRRLREPRVPSILDRLEQIVSGLEQTRYGPTATHRGSYELAAESYEAVAGSLRQLIDTDLPELEEELEAAGAPWTPGRRIPR